MFEPESDFFATCEDELVQVVKYKFQGLGVALVNFDDLTDAAGIKRLVLYVTEVTEDLLNFLLHTLSYYFYISVASI